MKDKNNEKDLYKINRSMEKINESIREMNNDIERIDKDVEEIDQEVEKLLASTELNIDVLSKDRKVKSYLLRVAFSDDE